MDESDPKPPSFDDIAAAAERLRGIVHRTPVLTCRTLDRRLEAELFFKAENLQKTGSFKARGATNAVLQLDVDERARGVVTHSSGNHAAALAWAAQSQGVRARVVMPDNSLANKIEAVRSYGAEVILCAPTLAAREETLAKIATQTGAVFVPPFDDARIIAGQGTAALEFLEEVPDLDALIAPVGGGGLLSGTLLVAAGREKRPAVYGAEPALADDAHAGLAAGERQAPIDPPITIADGLRTDLGDLTWPIIRDGVDAVLLAGEAGILTAARDLMRFAKWVVEPSGAIGLAALAENREAVAGRKIGIVLSGGNADVSGFFAELEATGGS